MVHPATTSKDGSGRGRPQPAAVHSVAPGFDGPQRGGPPTLASYATTVYEGWRTVLAVTIGFIALGVVYLFLAKPSYQATSLVQVEQRRGAIAGLEDLSSALGGEDPGDAELEILRSRMLVGSVVDQLNLTVDAYPQRFPVIGAALARRYRGKEPAAPLIGSERLARYGWGGERIQVDRLNVSPELVGKALVLTALEGGRFEVTAAEDGALLVEGPVSAQVSDDGSDPERRVEIFVSELVANPGTRFALQKRNREHVIDGIQAKLRVQQKGRRTGILVIDYEDDDPALVAAAVNAVANTYLRQNVERKSAEAAKTLEFIESQLPTLKTNLDNAEKALNAFRLSSGATANTSDESRTMLERERDLDRQISEVELRRSQLRQSFTENHPNLVSVANQLAQLKAERGALATRMRALPQNEVNSARLTREVQDRTNLYIGLLNRAQELRVVKSGTIGDVRIIDAAHVPDRPSSPKRGAVVVLTMLLGLTAGGVGAIVKKALAKCAESADQIEEATGLPVYVTVPHSDAQAELSRKRGRAGTLLSNSDPGDVAIETMRSLRTSLQFALVEAQNNVVAMAGPAPGVGKSFLAQNLAHVLAMAGRKVLLIDCDLRRGHLHRHFGLERKPGLSDLVSGDTTLEQAVHQVDGSSLFVLPTGRIPPNPAELLSSQRFEALLRDLSTRFELVVVDTPPILAVSDAMLVSRLAGVNLMVFRAGMHTAREIALSVKQFALNGVRLHGSILNDVRATRGGRYGTDGYMRYEYTSDASD